MKKTSGGILVLNQSSEKLSDRTIGDEVIITRARALNCISSNSCLKFRFSLNLWRNALSKKRVIRKPSKIHNTYFFLHVVLLLYFKDVLSTQKYCFAIFMYTLGWSIPLRLYHTPVVILHGCIMITTVSVAEIKEFPEFPPGSFKVASPGRKGKLTPDCKPGAETTFFFTKTHVSR